MKNKKEINMSFNKIRKYSIKEAKDITYTTPRIVLPKSWVDELGITEDNSKVIISKNTDSIIIKKKD